MLRVGAMRSRMRVSNVVGRRAGMLEHGWVWLMSGVVVGVRTALCRRRIPNGSLIRERRQIQFKNTKWPTSLYVTLLYPDSA